VFTFFRKKKEPLRKNRQTKMADAAKSAAASAGKKVASAAKVASSGAASVAKGANISQGTLIFAVVVSIYFIVYFAYVINEGVKDCVEDSEANKTLRTMSIATVVVGIIIILLVPLVCVNRAEDKPASSMHVYGATYTALVVSLYAAGLGGLSIVASHSKPNSKSMYTTLKYGGGIGTAAGALVFIFGMLALLGKTD
jgi:hypothetical protein